MRRLSKLKNENLECAASEVREEDIGKTSARSCQELADTTSELNHNFVFKPRGSGSVMLLHDLLFRWTTLHSFTLSLAATYDSFVRNQIDAALIASSFLNSDMATFLT